MAAGVTTNLDLVTVEAGDRLPESATKGNLERLDSYVGATKLTNKSGGQVVAGTVVIADTTADASFTTTATGSHEKVIGVVQETIANNAAGVVKHHGTSQVLVNGATAKGDWLGTSTTPGQAQPSSASSAPTGAFAIALTATVGSGTVTALLLVTATGSAFNYAKGSDIVAAAALTLGTGSSFDVTGTTGITSISTRAAGDVVALQFDSSLLMTHNATSLRLIGDGNHQAKAGEIMTFISEGSGNWRQIGTSLSPWEWETQKTQIAADTGYWRSMHLPWLPIASNQASLVTAPYPCGGGFSYSYDASFGMSVTQPGTANDLTKGFTLLTAGANASAFGQVVAYAGVDPSTDDFDLGCEILLNNSATRTILIGLKPTVNANDENEFLGFRIVNNGNIIGVSDAAGVETTRDSGLAGSAAPGTRYNLLMKGRAGTIQFFVNGAQVGVDMTVANTTADNVNFSIQNNAVSLGLRNLFFRMKVN